MRSALTKAKREIGKESPASEGEGEVDFENSPAQATLSTPTSPLIIAIDDMAAKFLNRCCPYKERRNPHHQGSRVRK